MKQCLTQLRQSKAVYRGLLQEVDLGSCFLRNYKDKIIQDDVSDNPHLGLCTWVGDADWFSEPQQRPGLGPQSKAKPTLLGSFSPRPPPS